MLRGASNFGGQSLEPKSSHVSNIRVPNIIQHKCSGVGFVSRDTLPELTVRL